MHVLIAASQEKADHAALEQSFKESQKVTCKDLAWPTTGIATQLPQPASSSGEVNNESSSSFSVSVCDIDASQYASYVASVQEKGFTVDYSKTDTAFNGKNEAGYSVHVSVNEYNKNVMDIAVYPPDDATDDSATTDSGSSDGTDGSTGTDSGAGTSGQSSTQSGASDDFKTAMDSYEQTTNGYVDFMNKYNAEGQPASMLVDYTKWLKQYTDTAQKLDAIDESTLSPEDQQYFIEVQTRINQKLATVQ